MRQFLYLLTPLEYYIKRNIFVFIDYLINLYLKIKPLSKNVLIIDNDQDIRDMLCILFKQEGYQTQSGPESNILALVDEQTVDIIIVDEWVNRKSDDRLCTKLKLVEQLKNIPVIVMSTANDMTNIENECKADDYIKKPFDIVELVEKVHFLLRAQA